VNFPRFGDLRKRIFHINPRPRGGNAENRGRLLEFPEQQHSVLAHDGLAGTGLGERALPGIIAGAADLDPAAVLTATVAGASFGTSVAFVVIFCIPILQSVFGVAARIGHETRLGLIKLIRDHFGVTIAVVIASLMVAVNVTMIVADLMAVSDAFSIVLNQPARFFPAVVAFVVWYILTLAGYRRVNPTLSLLALFLFSYVAAGLLATGAPPAAVHPLTSGKSVLTGGYLMAVIAVFGSLLTPDVVVWQTSTKREAKSFHDVEAQIGCVVACLVSLSVILAASRMQVADPTAMTTREAAGALAPLGAIGPILFSLGIIGSGLVALPILVASLCFSISEAANWDYGLNKPPWEARRFFVLICIVLLIAVIVNYFSVNTVKTLFWSQVLAGIFIVPILFFILWISNDRRIMKTTNSIWQNFWLGGAVGGMLVANVIFFCAKLFGWT
jgi:Mn2+/Fe2+ NRAMP family transporter